MRGRVLLCAVASAAAWSMVAPAPAAADLSCARVPQLANEFLHAHVAYKHLSPELESRTVATYVERLDPSRSVLLQSEVAAARASLSGILERMRKGDCQPLFDLQKQLVKANASVGSFVRGFVGDGYALDENVTLILDPAKRGSPATPEARDALQRSLVHFQISNYLSAGEPLEEARKRLVHRYELRTRRLAELKPDEVLSGFLDSFALALDPHSNYLSADVLEDFRISMSLSLEGIGVALSERDGYSVVERVIPGGAADRIDKGSRLAPEDKIIAVAEDGAQSVDIIDMPLREAVSLIRGKKGTKVQLTVLREGEKTERFPVTIERDTIDLAEQAAKLRFETRERNGKSYKLAIVELSSFYGDSDPSRRQCTDDLEKLLEQVKAEKADGLLLDLSRNGGGLLEHAVQISGFFLRRGEVVGVQNSREQLQVLTDQDERILYSGPMVVHTSRVSASASEILAGALKDYHRAVITGDDHTFGKGTVQTVTPLPPGEGALKITTALFFRPGGRSTQNEGVSVDVAIPSLMTTEEFGESTQDYALPSKEIPSFLSSYANALSPSDRFGQVDPTVISELTRRSHDRIEHSDTFQKLQEKIEKARHDNGALKLADLMRERDEAKQNGDKGARKGGDGGELGSADPSAEDEQTPQLEEAVGVLADLVELSRRGSTLQADGPQATSAASR